MLGLLELLLILSLSSSLLCNDETYSEYLTNYPFKGGNDPEKYKEDHKKDYIRNCYKLNVKKHVCRFANFTALMDWNDEELEELGRLSVEYSGVPVLYPESVRITQDEMSIERRSREFDDLEEYNAPEKKCSTSWATAAIRAAEAALNYQVELSEKQLFECLPKDLGFTDGCEGVHPKKLMQYLLEDGLVEKDAFKGCDKLDGLKKYYFMPNQPDPPTGSGLMNLLVEENKPAFVMMAIDLQKLMFVKDMTNIRDVVKCGGYQPSLYGILTGYKYSENTESNWWEIVTNIIPGEEIVMKIPMSSNMENANYAGIAAYAFTLREISEESSEIPTSEIPTVSEEPSYKIPLVPDKPSTPVPIEGGDDDEDLDEDTDEEDDRKSEDEEEDLVFKW